MEEYLLLFNYFVLLFMKMAKFLRVCQLLREV